MQQQVLQKRLVQVMLSVLTKMLPGRMHSVSNHLYWDGVNWQMVVKYLTPGAVATGDRLWHLHNYFTEHTNTNVHDLGFHARYKYILSRKG